MSRDWNIGHLLAAFETCKNAPPLPPKRKFTLTDPIKENSLYYNVRPIQQNLSENFKHFG